MALYLCKNVEMVASLFALFLSLEWMATNNWAIMLFPVEGSGVGIIKCYSLETRQMVPFVSRPE